MLLIRVVLLVAGVLVLPLCARAQSHEGIGIRAQGLAGAFVAVADDATATWWNPAGLPTGDFLSALVEIDEGGRGGAAFTIPQFGLSYYRMKTSEIRASSSTVAGAAGRQDRRAQGVGLSSIDPVSVSQFGATFGQSIGSHLVVASTVKAVWALSDTEADVDIGAMASLGAWRFGLSVRHATAPEFVSGAERFELPRHARAGVAVSGAGRGRVDRLTLAVDVDVTERTVEGEPTRHVAAGAEAWLFGHRVGVRGGAGTNALADSGGFGAAGASVAVRSGLYVDAVWTRGPGSAGDRWGLDLRVAF
jgi:hypothetical protein